MIICTSIGFASKFNYLITFCCKPLLLLSFCFMWILFWLRDTHLIGLHSMRQIYCLLSSALLVNSFLLASIASYSHFISNSFMYVSHCVTNVMVICDFQRIIQVAYYFSCTCLAKILLMNAAMTIYLITADIFISDRL